MNNIPKDVEIILNEYFKVFNNNLPNLIDSFYLTGSIVLDDYHEGKSDIDFVSVINRDMTSKDLVTLKKIHKEISSNYHKTALDGSYVTLQQIGKLDQDIGPVIYFDGKKIRYDCRSGNAGIVTWFMLKNYGITLIGDIPDNYLSNINVNDLISYVKLNANSYWVNWVEKAYMNFSIKSMVTLLKPGV